MKNHFEKRILHLGLGRFHRGHQCVYYQRMAELGDARWGVVSLSMRSPEARDQLRAVNLKYPVIETGAKINKKTEIHAIQEALSAQEDFARVMEVFKSDLLEIVTLTITEKGYCLDAKGNLDFTNNSIATDLKNFHHPESAIGLLALGLCERRTAGKKGLTIISCDNLRGNGDKLKKAVISYFEKSHKTEDVNWINKNVTFPNTMVDRIVPALTPEKINDLKTTHGLNHSELIATEEFSQWVIENKFFGERPPWEKVGVEFVSDVKPFEEIKLRLLNASHSFLAYGGLNKNYQFVHEAINDPELKKSVIGLMQEVIPLLEIPQGFDVDTYTQKVLSRFENFHLPHQLKQIAMDGSQKMPQRIFSSLMSSYQHASSRKALNHTVTSWLDYCWNMISRDQVIDDPLKFKMVSIKAKDKTDWSYQMLMSEIFMSVNGQDEFKKEFLS